MKLIPDCCFTFLLLLVLLPKEAEALAPLEPAIMTNLRRLAFEQHLPLAKMTYYAHCTATQWMNPPTLNVRLMSMELA